MSVCPTCRGFGFARGGRCWNCDGSGSDPDDQPATNSAPGVGEAEAIVRRWANWIIDESADRDDVSDHDAGKRKVRAERDLILAALYAPSASPSPEGGR